MRIVQINDTYGTGSIGRLSAELATYAEQNGHIVLFAHSSVNENGYHNSYLIGNSIDHKLHALLSRLTGLQGYFSYFATWKLIRRLKDFNPDIVHLENLHSNYINLPALFEYLSYENIATVITLHDCWFYTGKCTYYVQAKCDKWKKDCGRCPLLHIDNINRTYFFDRTNKCINDKKNWFKNLNKLLVVGPSAWVTLDAQLSLFSKCNKCRIIEINNWVDSRIFRPRKSSVKSQLNIENRKIVLMVSSKISKKKGYDIMIHLSKKLDDTFQIIVVGKNSANYLIPNNVIHIDHTNSPEQLSEYYSIADVCVNTTEYETFGMVTAESISCGTPVIVYNNTASLELVGSGCGIIVNEEDGPDAVIDAITEIIKKGKDYYFDSCINHAHMMFNKENQIKKYMDAYLDLYQD